LIKILLFSAVFFALTACEKEKQDSPIVGTVPKQIIDKATAIAAERMEAAENEAKPEGVEK
jgi:hypothetical protein